MTQVETPLQTELLDILAEAFVVIQEVDPAHKSFPQFFASLDLAESMVRHAIEVNPQQFTELEVLNRRIRHILEGKPDIMEYGEAVVLVQSLLGEVTYLNEIMSHTGEGVPRRRKKKKNKNNNKKITPTVHIPNSTR